MRPLLRCPREALADYAKAQDLRWIEDASNRNTNFDRNFCRHEILPEIERRWPDFRREWERSRRLIADSHELLTELAELDLERCAGTAESPTASRRPVPTKRPPTPQRPCATGSKKELTARPTPENCEACPTS